MDNSSGKYKGRQESFHKEKRRRLFFVPRIIRNGLKEVVFYPENSSLNI